MSGSLTRGLTSALAIHGHCCALAWRFCPFVVHNNPCGSAACCPGGGCGWVLEVRAVALDGEVAHIGSPVSGVAACVGIALWSSGWRGVLWRVVLVKLSPMVAAKPWIGLPVPVPLG